MTLRLRTKAWKRVVDAFIDEGVESGALMVHDRKDLGETILEEKHKLVTRVIFLLNITKVGENACYYAVDLVVVDISDGVVRISKSAFGACKSLTTVSFPTTLTKIDNFAFESCWSLENVDLLHTNRQGLGSYAFYYCRELKSMMIPDSLQTLGDDVFYGCSKLIPSSIDVNEDDDAVVAHLRSSKLMNHLSQLYIKTSYFYP
ncbi:hypothetical protein TL16_g07570 [Triparma laevis f. inornata]|uniref:Uncharacterized protein n=1 Tax=Triparma laevis f. inornata TaxID=1714386 RepID=A0A9W7EGD9_9STRA|nr:hypothetical protein TL16_g07570 [Triparma laevis f. inornata]